MWAARKGNKEIVDLLIKAGANVDTAGMVCIKAVWYCFFLCGKKNCEFYNLTVFLFAALLDRPTCSNNGKSY